MELIGVFGNKLFSVNCNVFILERDWGEMKTLNYFQGMKYSNIPRLISDVKNECRQVLSI